MGGKSTLLRQVCLTVILAQVGATASMLGFSIRTSCADGAVSRIVFYPLSSISC
ncbi:hypothetical protein GLYMA_03G219066v4 [Glycine max]|nr:hypothetical protein GLYMA_03G219066v4 [Glycine max]KAH1071215.1 hypothetical protein GYH30_008000 [Glycine max]